MSNTTLHNENVSVTLKSLGAELTSIKDASGTEYLWQGNPEFWSGQAPVLFPIVGCLRNGTAPIFTHSANSAIPAFPGAQKILSTFGLLATDHAIACSLPPLPTIKTFIFHFLSFVI